MTRYRRFGRGMIFAAVIFIISVSGGYSQTGPGAFLPGPDDIPGWKPAGEMKIWNETILGSLSPADKDLIMEYGFSYAVTARYYNYNNRLIDVRVFTMDNSFGACGLFMRSSRNLRVFEEYGNSSYEKPGEYGFWKQFYFVIMQSAASGDTVSEGFRQIASFIDSRIKSRGILPDILRFSDSRSGNVIIFKGPLALSEIYYFSPLNIFFIKEGIAIEDKDSKEIILKYTDNYEAVRRFSDSAGILSSMTKFSNFIMAGEYSFAMKDRDGRTLIFKVVDNCLHITIK
jgi:hypothetical protein